MSHSGRAGLVAALLLVAAPPAEPAPAAEPQEPAVEPREQPEEPDDAPQFAEEVTVTVTARKREEDLQAVPFSVVAPSGQALRTRGAETIEDVSANVAGFSVQNLGPGQSQVAMRGVSAGQIVRDQPGWGSSVGSMPGAACSTASPSSPWCSCSSPTPRASTSRTSVWKEACRPGCWASASP